MVVVRTKGYSCSLQSVQVSGPPQPSVSVTCFEVRVFEIVCRETALMWFDISHLIQRSSRHDTSVGPVAVLETIL